MVSLLHNSSPRNSETTTLREGRGELLQVIRAVKEVRSFSYVRPAECIIDQQRRQKEEEGEGRFICQKVGGGPKEEEEGPGDMPASSPTDRRLGGGGILVPRRTSTAPKGS